MPTLLEQLNNLDVLTSALMGGAAVQLQPIAGDVPVVCRGQVFSDTSIGGM